VERLLGDWGAVDSPALATTPQLGHHRHIQHDSAQTHIAVAYPSAAYGTDDYYQARGAVGILSDGMSSRLFTEIREKRGLCYTVSASCHSIKGQGNVVCYAGTTSERAQETLDVLVDQLMRLTDGVDQEELRRLKARIKTDLLLSQESSRARSGAIALDWYYLGRVQTLAEVGRIVDDLSCESINAYLASHPPTSFSIVTLGAKKLEIPVGIS
jgi:predicted Zn-dependent peptidase